MSMNVPQENKVPPRRIGELISGIVGEIRGIVRREIALAKAELTASAIKAGIGAAAFIVAGFFLMLAVILLLISAAYGLVAAGMSPWLAFLLVAVALILIAVVALLIGINRMKAIKAPERTIATATGTVEALKGNTPGQKHGTAREYDEVYRELYGFSPAEDDWEIDAQGRQANERARKVTSHEA